MKYKCIIVDDEPLAIEAIEMHLAEFAEFEISAKCRNAMEASKALQENSIDLIFLDINMPKISGISFIKSLKNPPEIIITTAYSEYALEGFELDVLDYLLKPISSERFLKAINKFYDHRTSNMLVVNQQTSTQNDKDHIYIRSDRKLIKIYFDSILYMESDRDYVKIITPGKTFITKNKISLFEEKLPSEHFTRVHRSYIVSNTKVDIVTSSGVEIGKKEIPVTNSYRNQLLKVLNLSSKII